MNIIIVGVGTVGTCIARELTNEGHNIIVVDKDNSKIESIVNELDVLGICGNGAIASTLEEASVQKCDLFISVAEKDEVNILSCLMAKTYGVSNTIARVRDPNYFNQSDFMCKELGISHMVNPERALAQEIYRMLRYPTALRVESIGHGACDLIEIVVREDSKIEGVKLKNLSDEIKSSVIVCAVERNGKVFIPDGEYEFHAGDVISFTANRKSADTFLKKSGIFKVASRSVFIAGGGMITFYLSKLLRDNGMNVKVIESDYDMCSELTDSLDGKVTVVHGEPNNVKLLEEEGVNYADAFVALTNSDEQNIVISLYLRSMNISKVIVNVQNEFTRLAFSTGTHETVVSNERSAAMQIVRLARTSDNAREGSIIALYRIANEKVEALTFNVAQNFNFVGKAVKDVALKKGLLFGSIVRGEELIIPNGNTIICENDVVLIVSASIKLHNIEDALE